MTKVDIFSGFLGAGKTTLIKKLIAEGYSGEKLVLIENEFGQIGIDSGFLQEAGINITEMNSGCICCSLVGDFGRALQQVLDTYHPDRILIEPSGVGKLSDVIRAVQDAANGRMEIGALVTVVDAAKCKMYMKNFGEFFNNQVESANAVVLSHTQKLSHEKIEEALALLRAHNEHAVIVTTDWDQLSAQQLRDAIEHRDTLAADIEHLKQEGHHHHHDEHCDCHEHHHHHHDEHCDCHEHHHHHDEHCDCHEHHHHHDEHCDCHEHHHHHHDEHCDCGCHDHDHHHADEVFISCGAETPHRFDRDALQAALNALCTETKYGIVLRAKGIVQSLDGEWIHFDYVPGEPDLRTGPAGIIGRLCVIGSGLDIPALSALLGVELK